LSVFATQKVKFNNKSLRMNQEIVFASDHLGQTDIVVSSKFPFASSKEMNSKLIYQWNEKDKINGIYM